jgi:hypothetical protein
MQLFQGIFPGHANCVIRAPGGKKNMRPWLVLHMPTRSLVTVVARSRERVLAICRTMGWRSAEVMIRVK